MAQVEHLKNLGLNELLETKEYYIAAMDELEIEETLHPVPEGKKTNNPEIEAKRAALREIDRLKAIGEYQNVRARLRKELEEGPLSGLLNSDGIKIPVKFLEFAERWSNLRAGMESPDQDQLRRFQKFFETADIMSKPLPEISDLLAVLEPAEVKKKSGRKVEIRPKWRKDAGVLDEMRVMVVRGLSIPEAARQMAFKEGFAHQDSRAKRFENLYRARLRLR
ncbi:hypothetical protein [Ruegeria sp. A3M17]|uniref:hypothetical protein n=1 Tax=Ruegeria sp. A3M17 TaxID=2267229 RepID=UPI000DE8D2DF|nr:hypothetical protein [Ruegeria sp. A3M17]RBW57441.1 hypothetical protein DS906_11580 [Ruegeria sp. A3M17]